MQIGTSLQYLAVFATIVLLFFFANFHRKRIANFLLRVGNHTSSKLNNTSNSTQCVVILRDRGGRLGNRLFMFATAMGLALNHSCRLYINPEIIQELNQSFELDLPSNIRRESELKHLKPVEKRYNHCSFFPELARPNTFQFIELLGFWQVHKYFVDYSDEIRRQLRFRIYIQTRVHSFFDKGVNRSSSVSVGIHIRRGDFLAVRRVSSDQYILHAIGYFVAKYRSVRFVIVTDDKPYCQKIFGKRKDILFTPDTFTAADDLAILTLCDHIIITVGTFGWWGAFLLHNRTGEVLTDSKPDHTPLDINCERAVYFPFWFSFLNHTA